MLASFVIMTATVILALFIKGYAKRNKRIRSRYRRTYDAWNRSRQYH